MFLFEQELQGSVTYSSHRVIGHSGNEYSEKLVGARLERQALVVLGTGEHLGHWMLTLKISHENMLPILKKFTNLCVRRVVRQQCPAHLQHVGARRGRAG